VFDISFGELLVVGAVTLIVVGPERMPKVARTAGMLFGRLQRFIANVKSELQQEMQMGELAQLEAQLRKEADDIQQSIQQPLADAAAMLAEGAQAIPVVDTPEPETLAQATEPEHGQLDLFSPANRNSSYRDRR
jgi:sec-independent protein translocase protein TatB